MRNIHPGRLLLLLLPAALCLLTGCMGDFDQREDEPGTIDDGGNTNGSTANPDSGAYVRGVISTSGIVRDALIVLRPVRNDGSIDLDDTQALGRGVSYSNGIYHLTVQRPSYRGPIVVEVRGQEVNGVRARGGNPATAGSAPWHYMQDDHVLYAVLPSFDGQDAEDVDVSPLTTYAVGRCLYYGGISAGMYGLMCQQTAEMFQVDRIRGVYPMDFTGTGLSGGWESLGWGVTALSQVALDLGVPNVFDFYLGMFRDGEDDGLLNGSIGFVPNTAIPMPDLTVSGLLGTTLRDNYLDPANTERAIGTDNTTMGNDVDARINWFDSVRDINAYSRAYDLVVKVPGTLDMSRGQVVATRILALDQLGGSTEFHPYGDSGGPSFTDFSFTSSAPAFVYVQSYGRITVDPSAPNGDYTLWLTVSPAPAQTFLSGPTSSYTITVKVR